MVAVCINNHSTGDSVVVGGGGGGPKGLKEILLRAPKRLGPALPGIDQGWRGTH